MSSGACAATVLLKDGELHVANVGDCRVVMSRKGVANALTTDHRPGTEDEKNRIESSVSFSASTHLFIDSLFREVAISKTRKTKIAIREVNLTKKNEKRKCEHIASRVGTIYMYLCKS